MLANADGSLEGRAFYRNAQLPFVNQKHVKRKEKQKQGSLTV